MAGKFVITTLFYFLSIFVLISAASSPFDQGNLMQKPFIPPPANTESSQTTTMSQATASISSLKILTWNVRYAPTAFVRGTRHVTNAVIKPGESLRSLLEPLLSSTKTFIRGHNSKIEGEKSWDSRRVLIADTVAWNEPDICFFQEVLHHQLLDLTNLLPEYDHVGVGRNDGKTAGEAVPIFWKRDKFSLVGVTYFWLSETPEVPGRKGWDAASPRMVTVARLRPTTVTSPKPFENTHVLDHRDLSKDPHPQDIFVVNTHFDDQGKKARFESSKLILERLEPLLAVKRNLVILAGDLNSEASDGAYKVLVGAKTNSSDPGYAYDPARKYLKFLDSRYNFMSSQELSEDSVNISPQSTLPKTQYLHYPYGQTNTWTGFTDDWERTVIDFVLIGNTGSLKKPRNKPPIITDPSDNSQVLVDDADDFDINQDNENVDVNAKRPKYLIDRYGVIPTRYEYKPRASDHRPVVVRLQRVD